MKKTIIYLISFILIIIGIFIIVGVFDASINGWVLNKIGRSPGTNSMKLFKYLGWVLIIVSTLSVFVVNNLKIFQDFYSKKLLTNLNKIDEWFWGFRSKLQVTNQISSPLCGKKINKLDIFFIIFAVLVSMLLVIERLQNNYPNVILGSDAANISSMAIAVNNPDYFEKDFYLQDEDNFKLYFQLHVIIIRFLGKILNNYTLPFVIILGPTAFITFFGNYLLGRIILKNRFWSVLLVIFNSIPVYLLFENWGIAEDSVPRTFLQALFPYLLSLIWIWKDKPKNWIIIAICTGLLTYVHAVGTPTIMAMVILGFLAIMPKNWNYKQRILTISGLSIIMIIVGSVFIINYLSIKQQVVPFDYETIIRLYRTYFPPNILDVRSSVQLLSDFYADTWLLPSALLGLFLLWFLRDDSRRLFKLTILWLLGIGIVSIIIPFSERIIEAYLRVLPIETELIRGTRFFVPVFGLITLASFSHLHNAINSKMGKIILILIGLLFVGHYGTFRSNDLLFFKKTQACLSQKKLLCSEKTDLQNLLIAINQNTSQQAGIFFSNQSQDTLPLSVRYISQRSLVYSWKDRGLGFSHPGKMLIWHDIYTILDQYETSTEWYLSDSQGFFNFVENLGADYVVIPKNNKNFQVENEILIYENPSYYLVSIDQY